MKTKRLFAILAATFAGAVFASAAVSESDDALKFNPADYTVKTLVMPDGKTVNYRAYEHIFYVRNVQDPIYQYLNFYVPESVPTDDDSTPIFLRTYVGGYMAAEARGPSPTDATGRALSEGYVVCIPGSRGTGAGTETETGRIFTGRAPAGIVDLKAALRYLHYNDDAMPGSAEKIITDGTSAGGAMSALMGATGNSPLYAPYLAEIGAAVARDDVFAAVCYCPVTDLDHADMAYEWLYACTNGKTRELTPEQTAESERLAAEFPAYLDSLNLRAADGTPITADGYRDYIASFIAASAQRAINEGCDVPEDIGIKTNAPATPDFGNGRLPKRPAFGQGEKGGNAPARRPRPQGGKKGEFVTGADLDAYLNHVASVQPLKTPPAFDALGVISDRATPENNVFGDEAGTPQNFTTVSLRRASRDGNAELSEQMRERVRLMNPMYFIGDATATAAPNWYIRHGARDRDTSFAVPLNLALKLMNNGCNVDFALPWNRPHSGDYNLDDLFRWIRRTVESGE